MAITAVMPTPAADAATVRRVRLRSALSIISFALRLVWSKTVCVALNVASAALSSASNLVLRASILSSRLFSFPLMTRSPTSFKRALSLAMTSDSISGCLLARARNACPSISSSWQASAAITVADLRGGCSKSAISPKKSPFLNVVRRIVCPSFHCKVTSTAPAPTRKIESPRSPSRRITSSFWHSRYCATFSIRSISFFPSAEKTACSFNTTFQSNSLMVSDSCAGLFPHTHARPIVRPTQAFDFYPKL